MSERLRLFEERLKGYDSRITGLARDTSKSFVLSYFPCPGAVIYSEFAPQLRSTHPIPVLTFLISLPKITRSALALQLLRELEELIAPINSECPPFANFTKCRKSAHLRANKVLDSDRNCRRWHRVIQTRRLGVRLQRSFFRLSRIVEVVAT